MFKINTEAVTKAFKSIEYCSLRVHAFIVAYIRKGRPLTRRQAEQVSYKHHFKNRHLLAHRFAR